MGSKKEKTPQSERDKASLSKAITNKGFAITERYASTQRSDARYKAEGANASKLSASNAKNMKQRVKQSRSRKGSRVAQSTMDNVNASAETFGITARSGLSNLQRKAAGAQSGVRSAAKTLNTLGSISRRETGKEHAKWVQSNRREQELLDLAALGVSAGLESHWESGSKTGLDEMNNDPTNTVDSQLQYVDSDPFDYTQQNTLTRMT